MVKRGENNPHISYIGTKGVPAKYGGAETGVQEISSRLIEKGYEITVFGAHKGKWIKRSNFAGIKTIDFPTLRFKGFDFLLRRIISTLFAVFSKKSKILHFYGSDAGLYYLLPKLFRKKIVITLDGLEWERESYSKLEKIFLKTILKMSVKHANHVVVDSQVFQEWLINTYNISSTYIPYAANFNLGLDDEVLKKYNLKKQGYIIFIGRLVEEKGIDILLDAFAKVKTDKKLVIIGDNQYNIQYVDQLKSQASKNVIFLGSIYGKEYEELLKGAFCYASASKIEGTSPSLVQAMAYGIPSVVSDIPTNIEVLSGTGLLFKNGESNDLRKKLQSLINDESLVEEFSKGGHQRALKFYSWDSVVEKIHAIYQQLGKT